MLFFPLLGVRADPAAAQQKPTWQDIALQAQKNAAVDQMTASAIINELQAEIDALKAQSAAKAPVPQPEPPK